MLLQLRSENGERRKEIENLSIMDWWELTQCKMRTTYYEVGHMCTKSMLAPSVRSSCRGGGIMAEAAPVAAAASRCTCICSPSNNFLPTSARKPRLDLNTIPLVLVLLAAACPLPTPRDGEGEA